MSFYSWLEKQWEFEESSFSNVVVGTWTNLQFKFHFKPQELFYATTI